MEQWLWSCLFQMPTRNLSDVTLDPLSVLRRLMQGRSHAFIYAVPKDLHLVKLLFQICLIVSWPFKRLIGPDHKGPSG